MDQATQHKLAGIENRIGSFVSWDGTRIEYRALGEGPGLVVLAGTLQTSQDYLLLAAQLAGQFTVYIPDRRGRGGSGPQGSDYGLQKECEDAIGLLDRARASFLFGHSYGGLIALNVARQYPLAKLAVYEPAVSIDGSLPGGWVPEFERDLAGADYAGAMATLAHGLQLGGKLNFVPRPVVKWMARSFMLGGDDLAALARIMPTAPAEARAGLTLVSDGTEYAQVGAETLLMIGGNSPAYFSQAARVLENVMPHARRQAFPGLDHGAPNFAPQKLAPALIDFFGGAGSAEARPA